MKYSTLLLALTILTFPSLFAQGTMEKTAALPKNGKLDVDLKIAENIQVKGWDKNEVLVKAFYEINGNERNDAFILNLTEQGNLLKINSDIDQTKITNSNNKDCPWLQTYSNGKLICATISYELFIPKDSDLSISSIGGNIEITDFSGPVKAKSINGFLDLSYPPEANAMVTLKSVTGEIFTDHELSRPEKGNRHFVIGQPIKGKLNAGGKEVVLETIGSHIYFRKSQH